MTQHRPFAISELRLLELLGFQFALDFDDTLQIKCDQTADQMVEILNGRMDQLLRPFQYRMRRQRSQLVGGPCNGRKHYAQPDDVLALHLARAKWAIYSVEKDGRAFYRGNETSERKARRKALELRARAGRGYLYGHFHLIRSP